MCDFVKAVQTSYDLLQDELSKQVLWARLTFDIDSTMTNMTHLLALNADLTAQELEQIHHWKDQLDYIHAQGKKLALYGTGVSGRKAAQLFLHENIDFDCFCGRRGETGFPNGLLGKPVISPDYLIQNMDEFYVMIFAAASELEIKAFLEENHFPSDQILHCFEPHNNEKQYFEFPMLYRKNTTFIDVDCCDCADDYRFIEMCNGEFSNIIAFVPSAVLYARCKEQIEKQEIRNFQLIEAGVSSSDGILAFSVNTTSGMLESNIDSGAHDMVSARIVAIDDVVDVQEVGFIKMDIEGAELDALHGAEKTILRDKPLLAICVYHRKGDTLAIMDYLHQLVPEYRFWLRHYGPLYYETVLYASVDTIEPKELNRS